MRKESVKLKKITDPEEILLLWKAGLIVNEAGYAWSKWRESRPYTTKAEMEHTRYLKNNAYVIVEEGHYET